MIKGKYRKVVVDSSVIESLLKQNTFENIELLDTLPEDAKLIHVGFFSMSSITYFCFESSVYSVVEVGWWDMVPALTPRTGKRT